MCDLFVDTRHQRVKRSITSTDDDHLYYLGILLSEIYEILASQHILKSNTLNCLGKARKMTFTKTDSRTEFRACAAIWCYTVMVYTKSLLNYLIMT